MVFCQSLFLTIIILLFLQVLHIFFLIFYIVGVHLPLWNTYYFLHPEGFKNVKYMVTENCQFFFPLSHGNLTCKLILHNVKGGCQFEFEFELNLCTLCESKIV